MILSMLKTIVCDFISGVFKSSSRYLYPLILESLRSIVVAMVRELNSATVRLNFVKRMDANIILPSFRNWSVYSFGTNQL